MDPVYLAGERRFLAQAWVWIWVPCCAYCGWRGATHRARHHAADEASEHTHTTTAPATQLTLLPFANGAPP